VGGGVSAPADAAGPTVRALPTAYDPPAGPTTVATPSCCCCCCCCLNTVAAGVGLTVGLASGTAAEHRRPMIAPVLLTLFALPLAIVVATALTQLSDAVATGVDDVLGTLVAISTVATYVAATVLAFRLAGAGWARSLLVSVVIPLAVLPLLWVEMIAAFLTAFIIELLAPGAFVGALLLGRNVAGSSGSSGPPPAPWPPEPAWPILAGPRPLPPPPVPPADADVDRPRGGVLGSADDGLPALPSGAPADPGADRTVERTVDRTSDRTAEA
jgi:streptolysin S family bacteriocin protoxin